MEPVVKKSLAWMWLGTVVVIFVGVLLWLVPLEALGLALVVAVVAIGSLRLTIWSIDTLENRSLGDQKPAAGPK
jgi:5-bromo-4-chloroindolyl phosphate hydrolysis protein